MNDEDKRLLEDYLPIVAISAEASREKSVRKGHISTLHLWWARRPLVACRAAVYGALVPASRFVPNNGSAATKKALGRANAAKFVTSLCKYPGDPKLIAEAQKHILEAHAERLTQETGRPVSVDNIEAGRAPRPKVLDIFAGGGAIPLEALRLGCEAYALDLNPVAHIIQLCTLVYPQKYGKADPTIRGMTGHENDQGETTWGGLAKEVRYWGEWVLKRVTAEIGDLYPLIPDPDYKGDGKSQKDISGGTEEVPPGYLMPVAYLWTRTVTCKNPTCGATVPLYKHTWLSQKGSPYIAMEPVVNLTQRQVTFRVKSAATRSGLGFDPEAGSSRGTTVCPFCKSTIANTYVMEEGVQGRIGNMLMCIVAQTHTRRGRVYVGTHDLLQSVEAVSPVVPHSLVNELESVNALLDVEIPSDRRESFWCRRYGLLKFSQLFTERQKLYLTSCAKAIRDVRTASHYGDAERSVAIQAYLACWLDKLTDYNSSLCSWHTTRHLVKGVFARQALPMVWDFAEINPCSGVMADGKGVLGTVCDVLDTCAGTGMPANVSRGSATDPHYSDSHFDAVITDPPYYDNISYAKLSDYFYLWMKNSLSGNFPEHFAAAGSPKKKEAVVDFARSNGDKRAASEEYEGLMRRAFAEANRVLKANGSMVCIYAHRTTLGWATLVEGLRSAGFVITEAWPLDTEMKARIRAVDNASLASSIFLVARKREARITGSYEADVQPELEAIVRERVETLWDMGISGADLVIACVGAGLRAFTRFARVEYANGDEVPAEQFLTEVETVVLDSILGRLSKEAGGKGTSLAGVDPATRFYTLWRYTYRAAELDAGEAIIFANGTHVELDGQSGMASGARALVEKKKGKYRLLDFAERGDDDDLGQPTDAGQAAPLVDVLHRVLWLMEHRPRELAAFLRETEPNREQLRLVAQALAGPALKGGEMADVSPTGEMAALAKLTSNWRSVIEDNATTVEERIDQKRGQKKLFE